MPEFVMPVGDSDNDWARWDALPEFVQGFIEAAFFTETGPDNEEEELGEICDFSEMAEEAIERAKRDCETFQTANAALLEQAYTRDDYDEAAAGRDFLFTRNGHGVGFWDRDQLDEGGLGKALSEACKTFSTLSLYRGDDQRIYFM